MPKRSGHRAKNSRPMPRVPIAIGVVVVLAIAIVLLGVIPPTAPTATVIEKELPRDAFAPKG